MDGKSLLKSLRKTVVKENKKERKIERDRKLKEKERIEKEVIVVPAPAPKEPPVSQFPRLKKLVQLRKKQILAYNVINAQYNPPYKYQIDTNVDRSPLSLTVQNIVLDEQIAEAPLKSARQNENSIGHKIVSNDDLTEAFKAEITKMKDKSDIIKIGKEKSDINKNLGLLLPTSPSSRSTQSMVSPNTMYNNFISTSSSSNNRYVVKPESSKVTRLNNIQLTSPAKKDASAYLSSFPFNNQSHNLTNSNQSYIPVTSPTLSLEKKRI
jgi:hypothetical protein